MTFLLFPDNTVLVNFAHISRVELLEDLLSGHGGWTATIAEECARSARTTGLADLESVRHFLGTPLRPDRAERVTTHLIRARLARTVDKPTDHLGEAEAFAIITSRVITAIFITDDVAATRLAISLGIRTMSTGELLKLAVHTKRLSVDDAWAHIEDLWAKGRTLPHCPLTLGQFRRWCALE